jgi:aminobenzoyl-glutamate transport protein
MEIKKIKEKMTLHPIMSIMILIVITILLSGLFTLLGVQVTYNEINVNTLKYTSELISVNNLFSLSGIKYIFSTTVSNFVSFVPLSSLIIILIGLGVMEKSGFLKTVFTLLTKNSKKYSVTFTLVFISIIASIIGDLSYVILIPISALLFSYGKRNPAIGIIATFAGLTCGTGINILFTSTDSSLLTSTLIGAFTLDSTYSVSIWAFIFIMLLAALLISFIITYITEKIIVEKVEIYTFEDEEEFKIGKNEKKGLIYSLIAGGIYILIFIYNIIPGLPFSGNLLDYTQNLYIDKLFSHDSFFSNGFVFIVTLLFILLGLFYGIGAKTIKNNKDLCDDLGHSLDGIGKILVLIFFASTFISIFRYTNIGELLVGVLANLLNNLSFTGVPLIILIFIIVMVSTLLVPTSSSKWTILFSTVVPKCMNAGLTPEFTQVIFRFAESVTMGLTPLFAYFVIYLAYLEKYNQTDKPINLMKSIKYQIPFAVATCLCLLALLIIFYLTGLPIGIHGSTVL